MANVALRFVPPDDKDLVSMKIYEGGSKDGPFNVIETVNNIGTYPNFITEYTTTLAASMNDWFALSWLDDKGAETALSVAIQGGTQSLVSEIIRRAQERIPGLSINVLQQESEGAIQVAFGESTDPYDPALMSTVSYRKKNGLTYMTLARTQLAELVTSSTVESATMGLIQMKSANSTNILKNIQELINMAEDDLGISGSQVIDMQRICHVYGGIDPRRYWSLFFTDQEFAFQIPWRNWPVEVVR